MKKIVAIVLAAFLMGTMSFSQQPPPKSKTKGKKVCAANGKTCSKKEMKNDTTTAKPQ